MTLCRVSLIIWMVSILSTLSIKTTPTEIYCWIEIHFFAHILWEVIQVWKKVFAKFLLFFCFDSCKGAKAPNMLYPIQARSLAKIHLWHFLDHFRPHVIFSAAWGSRIICPELYDKNLYLLEKAKLGSKVQTCTHSTYRVRS